MSGLFKRTPKTFLLTVAVMLLLFLCRQSFATAPERVVWDKHPIAVDLSVGEERLVHFTHEVRYWLPEYLSTALSVIAVNGVLYVTALREFDATRIRVQSLDNQTMYLLDVSASAEQVAATELIIMEPETTLNKAKTNDSIKPVFDWFIRLSRFAAQSLYAPERLLPSASDIYQMRLTEPKTIPLIRGGHIRATPLKSWRGGGYYLTAVKIQNQSQQQISIILQGIHQKRDQRSLILSQDLRGDWLAVTPQHTTLGTAHPEDTSTLYLLSKRPFRESLQ